MKFFLFCFLFLNVLFFSFSQSVSNNKMWTPNGPVRSILIDGDFTYIGGCFRFVGPENGNTTIYNLVSKQPDTLFPRFNGDIWTVVSDGNGGWYVGGDFTSVGTITRHNLVHINADRSIDSWNPEPDDRVYTLLINGSDLYVGGDFTTIAGTQNKFAAKFNINTGEVDTSWSINFNDPYASRINAMAIYQDSLFIAGFFSQVSNQSRYNLAKVSCADGSLSDWNPLPEYNSYFNVHTMCIKDSSLYIGGGFLELNSLPIENCAKINLYTGLDTSWRPNPNDHIEEIMPAGNSVILAGDFDQIGSSSLKCLAKVNDINGAVDPNWNPLIERTDNFYSVSSLCKSGEDLYIGGSFTSVGGRDEYNICRIDFNSARTDTSFKFITNGYVHDVQISGNDLFISGTFTSFGCERSSSVAKIDRRTGKVVPNWGHNDILGGSSVEALTLAGDYLYAGGDFTARENLQNLVRINSSTGEIDTTWNMHVNDLVECLLNDGTDLYIGGYYSSIDGKSRNLLSRMNLSSGIIDDNWNPNVVYPGERPFVMSMDTTGDYIYIGGFFNKVGGQSRKCIAKISKNTGFVDPIWNPVVVNLYVPIVSTVKAHRDYIYSGGSYYNMVGSPDDGLARININTGIVDTTWDPNPSNNIATLDFVDDALFIGGYFDEIGHQTRHNIAKVDMITGSVLEWNPEFNDEVLSIKVAGHDIYFGGYFTSINGEPHSGFAMFSDSVTTVKDLSTETPSDYYLYQNYPNPFNPSTNIKFILPETGKVVVRIYDILGKEIAALINNILPAGEHSINFEGKNLSSGVYFYRIEAGSFIETKKMLLLK